MSLPLNSQVQVKTKIDKHTDSHELMMRWNYCLRLHLGLINNLAVIFHAVYYTRAVVRHVSYSGASAGVKQSEIKLQTHYQVKKTLRESNSLVSSDNK